MLCRVAGVFNGHSAVERVLELVCGMMGEEESASKVILADKKVEDDLEGATPSGGYGLLSIDELGLARPSLQGTWCMPICQGRFAMASSFFGVVSVWVGCKFTFCGA